MVKVENAIDVEKGSGQSGREQGKAKAPAKNNANRRLWHAIGAVIFMGIAIFIVAFPITYINNNDSSDDSDDQPSRDVPDTPDVPKERAQFVTSASPFKVQLSLVDETITHGYSQDNQTELEEDLRNVARFLLNNVVNRNTGKRGFENAGMGQRNPNIGFPTMDNEFDFAESPGMDMPARQPVSEDLDDYGTNNQEDDVEEGDTIVSDGNRGKA